MLNYIKMKGYEDLFCDTVFLSILMICCFHGTHAQFDSPFAMTSRSGFQNILSGKRVVTEPATGTCGDAGRGSVFILKSTFEYGGASSLFRSGEPIQCTMECDLTYPRQERVYEEYLTYEEGARLGNAGCTIPQGFVQHRQGDSYCYLDVKLGIEHVSPLRTYSMWVKPNANSDG